MGAPPPAQFRSTTKIVMRGANKHPDQVQAFRARMLEILAQHNGRDGLLANARPDGFVIENSNPDSTNRVAFEARFKALRTDLEQAVEAHPLIEVYLPSIDTHPRA